jgi:hypothetical protein
MGVLLKHPGLGPLAMPLAQGTVKRPPVTIGQAGEYRLAVTKAEVGSPPASHAVVLPKDFGQVRYRHPRRNTLDLGTVLAQVFPTGLGKDMVLPS